MVQKKSTAIFLSLMMVFSLNSVVVFAQDTDERGEPGEMPQVIDDDYISAKKTALNEEKRIEIEARIARIKEKRDLKLETKRENILVRKCTSAQAKIASFMGKVGAAKNRRENVYSNFSVKLGEIVTRLSTDGVDVGALAKLLTTYDAMASDLSTNIADLLVVLDDLTVVDCTEDPEGFQAVLEEARESVKAIKGDVSALHSFLKNEIKQAFKQVINDLKVSNSEESDENQKSDELEE
jgi:SepF-like predicted cell division protein (DUF552 family)